MKDTDFRTCKNPDCIYVRQNEYGIDYCSLDNIIQVPYYACIPQEIINKKKKDVLNWHYLYATNKGISNESI